MWTDTFHRFPDEAAFLAACDAAGWARGPDSKPAPPEGVVVEILGTLTAPPGIGPNGAPVPGAILDPDFHVNIAWHSLPILVPFQASMITPATPHRVLSLPVLAPATAPVPERIPAWKGKAALREAGLLDAGPAPLIRLAEIAALFEQASHRHHFAAAQIAVFVRLLQHRLHRVLIAVAVAVRIRLDDGDRDGPGNTPSFDRLDQPYFAPAEQQQNAAHPGRVERRLAGDGGDVIAALLQHPDGFQLLGRMRVPPRDILDQAHDEGIFIGRLDQQRRDRFLPECQKRLDPSLAEHQGKAPLAAIAAWRHGDRLLEAEALDRGDQFAEDFLVARAGIEDINPLDRNIADFAGVGHAALRTRERAAMR